MPNPQIEAYLNSVISSAKPLDIDGFKAEMKQAGWSDEEVLSALDYYASRITRPNLASTESQNVPQATTTPAGATPAFGPSQFASTHTPSTHTIPRVFIIVGVAIVILVSGGIVATRFIPQLKTMLGLAPYNPEALISESAMKMMTVQSGSYEVTFGIEGGERQEGVVPYDPPRSDTQDSDAFLGRSSSLETAFAGIPRDARISLGIAGSGKAQSQSADGTFKVFGTYEGGGVNMGVDGELKKVGTEYYGRINKFPSVLMDFSLIVGKWVRLTGGTIGLPLEDITTVTDQYKAVGSVIDKDRSIQLLQLLEQTGAIRVTETGSQDGFTAYRVQLDREGLIRFDAEAKKEVIGYTQTNEFDTYLKSEEAKYLFDYMDRQVRLEVQVDGEGYVRKMSYRGSYAPKGDTPKLKTSQYTISLVASLNDLNKPLVVEKPVNAIEYVDAVELVTGEPKSTILISEQSARLRKVMVAISSYQEYTNSTPNNLAELKKTPRQLGAQPHSDRLSSVSTEKILNTPLLKEVPKDIFTESDFVYRVTSAGPELSFQIQMPKPEDARKSSRAISESTYVNSKRVYVPMYVQGTNTISFATEEEMFFRSVASVEAQKLSTRDSDGDTYSDELEKILGTDPYRKDTDGDGVSDADEFMRQTDPTKREAPTGSGTGVPRHPSIPSF